jgi:hypothetical protein
MFLICYIGNMKPMALFIAFLLEIAAVFALAYSGLHMHMQHTYQLAFGIIWPVCFVLFWAMYMAPKSKTRLKQPYYSMAKFALFTLVVALLASAGKPAWSAIFTVIAIIDELLLFKVGENKPRVEA